MARPKLGTSPTQRLAMMITEDEIARIDEWRFRNRIGSRSEAVRQLCALALDGEEVAQCLDDPAFQATGGLAL